MMPRSGRPGFSLVELMVAIALFAVVAGALAGFYGMVFGNQYRRFADLTVANGETLVRRAFDTAMGSATYLQSPSSGTAAATLTAWTNLDADGRTPLVTGAPVQFSTLCLDGAGQQIYLYQGSFPKPDFSCGESTATVTRMLLAGGPGFQNTSLVFYRAQPNLVQMTCGITLTDPRGLDHSATLQTQAVANANDQD
jgi:prepilin-type N-terminal cleavage/methylation domain-containing protein